MASSRLAIINKLLTAFTIVLNAVLFSGLNNFLRWQGNHLITLCFFRSIRRRLLGIQIGLPNLHYCGNDPVFTLLIVDEAYLQVNVIAPFGNRMDFHRKCVFILCKWKFIMRWSRYQLQAISCRNIYLN